MVSSFTIHQEVYVRISAIKTLIASTVLVALAVLPAQAQDGFKLGHTDVGPVIGLGGIGGADLAIGGRFEKAIREAGNGVLGLGVAVDRWSWGDDLGFDVSYLPISVTLNYHFNLENKKIDPFLGLGLGYERISVGGSACTIGGVNYCDTTYASGLYFVGHAGIRYFFQPKTAFYVDAGGGGGGALHVGLMFKIGQ